MFNKILLLLLVQLTFLYGETNLAENPDSLRVKSEESELSNDDNYVANNFKAIFNDKGKGNYLNRTTFGVYADFKFKYSIKDDDELDYPQELFSDEFLVFNPNDRIYLGAYANYKLSSYMTDNLLLKFNFDLAEVYHDVLFRKDIGRDKLRKDVFRRQTIFTIDPGIKYSSRKLERSGSAFISVGLPISLIESTEEYQYWTHYYLFNNSPKYKYTKEDIELDMTFDASFGSENIVKYISRETVWNEFKKGYSISFNFNSNIVSKDSLDTSFWFQEVKSLSLVEYAFLLDNYDLMINPYICYEAYLLTKDKDSSSFKSGINMAFDANSFMNFELNCGFEHFLYTPSSLDVKSIYAHPQVNIFFYDLICLSGWIDYQHHQVDDNKSLESHGFGADISMLLDF